MSYENAPATLMLATHCIACGRPLVDSVSVQAGMGPDCREKYGYGDGPAEGRDEANRLVAAIAADPGEALAERVAAIQALGFTRVAARIIERCVAVKVSRVGDRYAVRAPYDESAVRILAAVPGRQWVKADKVNTYPTSSRMALWGAIQRAYPGSLGIGPDGRMFEI